MKKMIFVKVQVHNIHLKITELYRRNLMTTR